MINYTWTVTSLWTEAVNEMQDYVVIAGYEINGVEDEYSFTLSNSIQFSTESVSEFIPYDQLTNDIVIGWIQEELTDNGVSSLEAAVAGQIESQKNPPVTPQFTQIPWN